MGNLPSKEIVRKAEKYLRKKKEEWHNPINKKRCPFCNLEYSLEYDICENCGKVLI